MLPVVPQLGDEHGRGHQLGREHRLGAVGGPAQRSLECLVGPLDGSVPLSRRPRDEDT